MENNILKFYQDPTTEMVQNNQKHKNAESQIQAIQISLASPELIISWSNGEVTKAETINYKSLKPEKCGLFDEVIFGPVKDYECTCGRYKKIKFRGKKCERCKVDITEAIVRRERMGHIELACPVAHIWMLKELPLPSKISLVLGMSYKSVEEIIYFVNYIVLNPGFKKINEEFLFAEKEVINISDNKNSSISRSKLRRLLRFIYEEIAANPEQGIHSLAYHQGSTYYQALSNSNLPFSIHDVFAFIEEHTGMKVGIGAEAIYELLKLVNLTELENELIFELNKQDTINYSDIKVKKVLRRLSVIRWLQESGNRPEWMILKVIPVIPPDLRPIIQLDGGRFTTSDINTFYRRIIIRNDRLKRIIKLNAAPVIANNEKRMLQEAVDSLIDNNARKKPLVSKDKHPLKSLTEHLKGKQGLIRQNLLGKRVDYSGRSVIVVGPELKMYEVGLPISMILKLFKPFIIHELIKTVNADGEEIKPIVNSIRAAEKIILKQEDEIWPIVQQVIKERPVLLNRAPTLHRLGIQAFEPKLAEGKAICLHPLVTTAFNADFDGDQMAVHLPISLEAIHEARAILLAPHHILSPKDGKPIITPTQDMILGIYYLTMVNKNAVGTGSLFATYDEAFHAYSLSKVHLHAVIAIPTNAFPEKKFKHPGLLITTVGKLIFNNAFPANYKYINNVDADSSDDVVKMGTSYMDAITAFKKTAAFTKSNLAIIIEGLHQNYPAKLLPEVLDKFKDLGFEYSTKSCTTISAFDVPKFNQKYTMFEKAEKTVKQQKYFLQKGWLTEEERYKNVIDIWNKVKENVSGHIKKMLVLPEYENNSIVIMAKSGARGNISNFTQLSGMRGLMGKSYNYDQKSKSTTVVYDVIELPIKHSFIEGLSISEYFNSSYGARKGMTDTAMKTSKSGYMTRKLVDATQEIIVKSLDCGTLDGISVSQITDTRLSAPIESLRDRILDRYTNVDIHCPKTNELIVARLEIISPEIADKIIAAGFQSVEIRSIFCCKQPYGVCQKCFGHDLTTKKPIEIGVAIGVIAAQSVGEPGTQLTMRTFHSGGVAGESNVSQGFERLKQLFDMISPKKWEQSIIAEINGIVTSIKNEHNSRIITIENDIDVRQYVADINSPLRVKVGNSVKCGDKITEGSIDIKELLDVAGIQQVRQYMIKEIQKLYCLQGIEISDRYIEIIIRQLTCKLKILASNDSNWSIHDIVDQTEFQEEASRLLLINKVPPTAMNIVFGLEEAAGRINSFLSAASFQDTKKILTDAAIKGQVDYLNSLKENVIMGNLIPVGTGLKTSEEVIQMGEKIGKFNY